MLTQYIFDYAGLGNQICMPNAKMLNMVSSHKFPCCGIANPSKHFCKFGKCYHIGICFKQFFIMFACSHNEILHFLLSTAEDYAII